MSKCQKFIIEIDVFPKDFSSSDLEEAIKDGLENVGNYNLNKLKISKNE